MTSLTAALTQVLVLLPLLLPVAPPVSTPLGPDGAPTTAARGASPEALPALSRPAPSPAPSPAPAWRTAAAPAPAVWPLAPQPEVVAAFDPPSSTYGAGHRGVDLAGTAGQTVRAAAAGTVTFAGALAGRGVVVVTHGVTRTTYEPVTAGVRVGEAVTAGQPIGNLESTGSHCAPAACLHWGLLEGTLYLDPLTLVGAGPVRLLPLLGDGSDQGAVARSTQ